MGDSITLGGSWYEFFPDVDVLNRGIGSDTTEGMLHRIDEVIQRQPQKVFIMCGINDLGSGIDMEQSVRCLQKMIDEIRRKKADCKIFIQSVLPCVKVDSANVIALNDEYQKIASFNDCTFINLYSDFIKEDNTLNQELFSADGVHLNGNGYQIWIDNIEDFIYN